VTTRPCALFALGLLAVAPVGAHEVVLVDELAGDLDVSAKGAQPQGGGYGYVAVDHNVSCLSVEERSEILASLEKSRAELVAAGKLRRAEAPGAVSFDWPLAPAIDLYDDGLHGISNFVDQDPAFPGQLLDYNCGDRTYDTSGGYNHLGVDFFTWPFGWYKMDHDQVEIVAAAPGTILWKQDGNFDRSCSFGGTWNAVYVEHADGSVAWYGHMKKDSLTPKAVGTTVVAGERLGIVGSSGSSTGPHLHLEVHDALNAVIDPYEGPCNSLNSTSWWKNQRPYYDSAVNALMTHSAPPVFPACPEQETLNARREFSATNPRVYFAAYFRDQRDSQTVYYRVLRPNGELFASWSHNSDAPHYAASWWYWWFNLGSAPPEGVWTFEVTFRSVRYDHRFGVGPNSMDLVDDPVRKLVHGKALDAWAGGVEPDDGPGFANA